MNYNIIIDNGRLLYKSQPSDTRLTTWLLNSIQLSVFFYREIPLSPIDKLICSLLINTNGQIKKEELGLTLGFDIVTKVYNGQAFYADEAECKMYDRILKQVEEWKLISIDKVSGSTDMDEDSNDILSEDNKIEENDVSNLNSSIEVVRITKLGKLALEKGTKFTFHESEILLYSNMLSTGDKSIDDNFSYPEELNVFANILNTKSSSINPDDFDFTLNSQYRERLLLQLDSNWNGHIFAIEPQHTTPQMEKCYVDFYMYNYENERYILSFRNGQFSKKLTDILYVATNAKVRNQKIKRCLYYRLINESSSVFNYDEVIPFWDIIEEEEYDLLVNDNRIDWNDSLLFELIIFSEYFSTQKKTLITQIVPLHVLKKYISRYQEYIDWRVLSSRIDVNYIVENFRYPWGFDTILSRKDISIEEAQNILKLPVLCNVELEWDLIVRYLTVEFVEGNIDKLKFDHYYLTSWLPVDCLSVVFSHLDKQWDWDYLTNHLSLQSIEENINALESHINVISFIDRCFYDSDNMNFAIQSLKFKTLFKTAIANGRFNNYSLQDKGGYIWTDSTIKYFEEIGLLSWRSKQYEKGFPQFNYVKWTKAFFAKYHTYICCQEDKTFVSDAISDINLISDYPNFEWDWSALSQNTNIAYCDTFIEKFDNKIDIHSWIKNATVSSVELFFDKLNLREIFNNETSVKTLSEKVSKSFISKHRDLAWSSSAFTYALLAEVLLNKSTFTQYLSKWDWDILSLNVPLTFILSNIENPWTSSVLTKAILSQNTNIISFVSRYNNRIDWSILSKEILYKDFSLIADQFCEKWDWNVINQRFVTSFTSTLLNSQPLRDKLDWNSISASANAYELIKSLVPNASVIKWDLVTSNICPILTLELLKNDTCINNWDWHTISQNAEISLLMQAIDNPELPLCWNILTERFSADYILSNLAKYQNNWDWNIIWESKFSFAYVNEKKEELAIALNTLNSELSTLQWTTLTRLFLNEDILRLSEVLSPNNGYNWNYKLIYDRIQNIEQYVKESHSYIDWSALSKSKAADILFRHDIETFDIRIWKILVKKNLSNPLYNWDYKALTQLENVQKQHTLFFKNDIDKWDWDYISEFGSCLLPENNRDANLRKYKDHINFALLSKRIDVCLNEEIIESFIDEQWDWSVLSANRNVEISINFVFAHKDKKWDWKALSRNLSVKWSSKQSQKNYPEIFKNESINKTIDWNVFLTRRDLLIDKQLLKLIHTYIVDYWTIMTSNRRFIPSIDTLTIAEVDGVNLASLNWDIISESKFLIRYKKDEGGKSIPQYNFIQKYASYINWEIATQNSVFDIYNNSLLDSFKDYVDWSFISKELDDEGLNISYLNRYKEYLNWPIINSRFDYSLLNVNALKDLEEYLDWSKVSCIEFEFTNELLSSYVDKWDWSNLMQNKSFKFAFNKQDLSIYQHKLNVAKFIDKFRCKPGKIYHFTHLFNVLEVLRSRKILSRNRALELSKLKFDSAGGVVGRTAKAHPFARFYYRPATPTQFYNECLGWDCDLTIHQGKKEKSYYSQALNLGLPKCPIPVFLEFDLREVLTKMSSLCYYSDGNMQTNWANVYKVEDTSDNLRMDFLYNDMSDAFNITLNQIGEFDQSYFMSVINLIKEQSQQEFLVKDEFDFSRIDSLKIHCYDEGSANLLKKYLGKDPIAERIVVGGCFIYQNRNLDFYFDEGNKAVTISSTYNGQGDAYFLVKGNVNVINKNDIRREVEGGIVMYPTVKVENTDKPFDVYFIDKRARTTDWLVYSNSIESSINGQIKQYHIDDYILDEFVNIKSRIDLELNADLFYKNMINSYHGIAHTSRVLFATHLITSIIDGVSESLKDAAYYAAIIHDLGKTNDREGFIHGMKSMNRYGEFIDKLEIESSLKQRMRDAIRYHSVEDNLCPEYVQNDILWKILKDADALDRSRFGGRGCDIKYLRLPIFKTDKGRDILGITCILSTITNKCKWNDPYSDIIKMLKSYVL